MSLNRNTINRDLAAFRERITWYCEAESPVSGEVELDESYFGQELEVLEAGALMAKLSF